MRTATLLLLVVMGLLAVAMAAPSETHVLNDGAVCAFSFHCKSGCCGRTSGTSLARCTPKSAETEKCSPKSIYGSYYYCPCQNGLKCHTDDWSVGGIITNTNFGVCKDPNAPVTV